MLQELERVLLSRWDEFGCAGQRPKRFLFILSAERHLHSKAVFYCLPQDKSEQVVVVKIQKDDLQQPLLENEYARLKALHGQESLRELRNSIPRPLFFGEISDRPALIETYISGVPFSKHCRRREPDLFLKASKWLSAFHSRTVRARRSCTDEEIGVHFLQPLEPAIHAIDGRGSLQHFLDNFRQRLPELSGAGLPLVFSHNDLCLNNIRFQENRVGVIDWEFSCYPDLPLHDLINAFLFFAMTWKRISYTEAFRLAFSGDNGLSLLMRQCLRDYSRELGLTGAMLRPLIVQYLISRIPLLHSVGNVTNCEETIWCLQDIAEGRVDLRIWEDLGQGV